MGWDLLSIAEYIACAVVVSTAFGIALSVVGLSREAMPALTEDERGDLAIW